MCVGGGQMEPERRRNNSLLFLYNQLPRPMPTKGSISLPTAHCPLPTALCHLLTAAFIAPAGLCGSLHAWIFADAAASIRLCWGPMLKLGKGCFWELFSPEWTRFMCVYLDLRPGNRNPTHCCMLGCVCHARSARCSSRVPNWCQLNGRNHSLYFLEIGDSDC